jgi:hypothetical protein
MRRLMVTATILLSAAPMARAQDAVRLIELFSPDYQYRVSCRVAVEGTLKLPPAKDRAAPTLKITGKSAIDYHERVLSATNGKVERTVRKVQQMDFTRNVGGQDQESKLRGEVSLLVIQRLQNLEVPFSPQGPLTLGEIELVRTDVFTPALVGLLPKAPVRPGETWVADVDAVKELTDLETIDKGRLTCRYEGVEAGNQRLARVSFQGSIRGVGEDGQAEHQLDGYYLFDLQSHNISYVSLEGKQLPLDKNGVAQGEIKGTFVLTRDPDSRNADLDNAALARWNLTPNDDNTQLLFDGATIRFLYPRQWRVDEANDRQIRLAERQGSELLITLDPVARLPELTSFYKEVLNGLQGQKAQLVNIAKPRVLQATPYPIEHFGVEARFGAQPASFDYYIIRQNRGGATLSARYPPAQADARRRDIERIIQSAVLNVK